jgi:hypothetical protein
MARKSTANSDNKAVRGGIAISKARLSAVASIGIMGQNVVLEKSHK